ncbi:MAG TPA: hypothetical protein VHH88_03795, partial [Verrucomicrobiae bacterium]|nr:hypothetical protein [Verrucomicrobiae bacterium]
MIRFLRAASLPLLLLLAQFASAQIPTLVPLAGFGTNGDGTIRANDVDWLNDAGQIQRGMAWNPVTGHILLVCRTNAFSPTYYRVMILDGATGAVITNEDGSPKQLDLSSLVQGGGNGSFLINMIGVADDGAIYAANLSNSQTPAQSVLYRWENEDAPMSFVWLGDPASGIGGTINRRWGDTF